MKRYAFFIALMVVILNFPKFVRAVSIWPVQSIDIMKISRDEARQADIMKRIPTYVTAISALHPTHIAIGTPYDEEFYPVLKAWVSEIRKHDIQVWFRGNFSGWEGWFDYPKFEQSNEHTVRTKSFILKHPDLFSDGDIFTPAPEPENGIIGDPRKSEGNKASYLSFLVSSQSSCRTAFADIAKNVTCGLYSMNGDIARDIITQEVAHKLGVIVIDHYVKTPEKLVNDVIFLNNKFQVPILLGEFGAPIPDINGSMTASEQATYVGDVLRGLVVLGPTVMGMNYWTAFGGTTEIFDTPDKPKLAAETIATFYNPRKITGTVSDTKRRVISHIEVSAFGGVLTTETAENGSYAIFVPRIPLELSVLPSETFKGQTRYVEGDLPSNTTIDFIIERKSYSVRDRFLDGIESIIQLFNHAFRI